MSLALDLAQCTQLAGKLEAADVVSKRDVLWQLQCTDARGCLRVIAMSGLGRTVAKLLQGHQDAEVRLMAAALCAYWKTLITLGPRWREATTYRTTIRFHIPGKETPEEGLRRGGGVSAKLLAELPTEALAIVFDWLSPPPPAPC